MEVLIVSKTQMGNGKCCVGGLTEHGENIRLLTSSGENQSIDSDFEIRQVWDMVIVGKQNTKIPHVEDVLVTEKKFVEKLDPKIKMIDVLKKFKIKIWQGNPDNLFHEIIKWTKSGSGYINHQQTPLQSVGFWIADQDLNKRDFKGVRYNYHNAYSWRSLKYVGLERAVETIPVGTLMRVSLARWWSQDQETEARCYLQLSGWYDYREEIQSYESFVPSEDDIDNLPF